VIQYKYTIYFSYHNIKQRNKAIKLIAKYFDATIQFAIGVWNKQLEPSVQVEILYGRFEEKIEKLCRLIKDVCEQDAVLYTKEYLNTEMI